MEGLFTLLIFAVLFFFMMRFGCGSHMKHEHKSGAADGETGATSQNDIDPVCAMKVEKDQGYGLMHEGQLYRFCSRDCLDKFESDPEQYVTESLTHENQYHEGGKL